MIHRGRARPTFAPSTAQTGQFRTTPGPWFTTRLVVATGDPQPGNRNDCTVYRESGIDQQLAGQPVIADGGYYGVPDVIIPFRKPVHGEITDWQEELNTVHRRVRARVEHAIGQMKTWKILRDYRRAAHILTTTASRIAYLRNIAFVS
jgi:hypothetical protein